ncbi:hypothetical protein B0H13DRAFT_1887347 [Mycena leptocephala]|nr:hypothetical protein B0H13DRAFT_1887347 [Mycena leptocephala]
MVDLLKITEPELLDKLYVTPLAGYIFVGVHNSSSIYSVQDVTGGALRALTKKSAENVAQVATTMHTGCISMHDALCNFHCGWGKWDELTVDDDDTIPDLIDEWGLFLANLINPSTAVSGCQRTGMDGKLTARNCPLIFEADAKTARAGVPLTGPVPPVKTATVSILVQTIHTHCWLWKIWLPRTVNLEGAKRQSTFKHNMTNLLAMIVVTLKPDYLVNSSENLNSLKIKWKLDDQ